MQLSDVVRELADSHQQSEPELGHVGQLLNSSAKPEGISRERRIFERASTTSPPLSQSAYKSTPSARTGPPRSFSYNYTGPSSSSRMNSVQENADIGSPGPAENGGLPFEGDSSFRGVLDSEQRNRSESSDRKGKKREAKLLEEPWNPLKWFHDPPRGSPQEEKGKFDFDERKVNQRVKEDAKEGKETETETDDREASQSSPDGDRTVAQLSKSNLQRSQSMPHSKSKSAAIRWGRLRSMLPNVAQQSPNLKSSQPSTVAPQAVNITDELMVGGLSTLMLRLWFERDEKGQRRIPVLFHRLRIRVSDSLHPLHGSQSVFRIECEYANGAARWVIYRQLRDFLSLHTHYKFSNAYFRNVEDLPEFPRTSLPYFKFLKRESSEKGGQVGAPEFARLQREALENYLIQLIRAVIFHPSSNRLAGFLEISALSISLAQSGGAQYKAGYLQIQASGNKGGGFGRKSVGRVERKKSRWCAVRESYLVVLTESGELDVWDVFLIDSDFKIERPTRYYRQGMNILQHPDKPYRESFSVNGHDRDDIQIDRSGGEHKTAMGSIRSGLSKVFHIGHHGHARAHTDGNGHLPAPQLRVDSATSARSSSSASSTMSQPTPMLDPSTNTNPLDHPDESNDNPHANSDKEQQRRSKDVSKHTFYIENAQMRLKLFAHNERQMLQWITALEKVAATSHYTGSNRFDSFAPIRLNVAAQWLVDGRDYFWNLSRALLLAHETIYIHDWWLSPELQMRRPNKDKYRLDRILEKKAKEGVKIHIILYQEVSSRTTPTESNYTKQRLTALHPNIMVQRSPSHFQTGTFYWAHHEKICVIDGAIAFMGGLDLCFGRWDTPQHVLVDDPGPGSDVSEIWPGKDYSNPRIQDFHNLAKPEEDMYDRAKIPRMPWHDVSMQIVGPPARDLARHFVERWNYLLRIKNHTRVMPFLLPHPEFKPGELTEMGLTGTCELQICRSAGPWSLGTPSRIEHSIQNAYLKAIQLSEHFVYIENQFFITSTTVNEVKVENRIGDALVHRIIRAHREGTPWKCCIIIPVIPGFAFPVDHSDASAIRIIMECQNRTICRGPHSIFSRLRKEGIDPDEYISVFSLRNWAKLRGEVLTTEQVYIHGKVCIVDDRLAIIGSANINERSQRGDRDSEVAAIIRDTDMIDCTMAGKPFKVGRFAHTLRIRLMREHIGVDVDAIDEEDLMASDPVKKEHEQDEWDPNAEQAHGKEGGITRVAKSKQRTPAGVFIHDTLDGVEQAIHGTGDAGSKSAAMTLRKIGIKSKGIDSTAGDAALDEERKTFSRDGQMEPGFASSVVPTLEEKLVTEHRPPISQANDAPIMDKVEDSETNQAKDSVGPPEARTQDGQLFGAPADASRSAKTDDQPPHARAGIDDADEEEQAAVGARSLLRKHLMAKLGDKAWRLPAPAPKVDPNGFEDPVCDEFWKNVWVACAVHNTEIYRKVFHAIPDDLVTTWKQYKEFVVHHERLNKPCKEGPTPEPVARVPSETADADAIGQERATVAQPNTSDEAAQETSVKEGKDETDGFGVGSTDKSSTPPTNGTHSDKDPKGSQRKSTPNRGPEPFEKWEREEMEKLLGELCGHLVIYPTRFLEGEDVANNFLFNADRLLPLPIYD